MSKCKYCGKSIIWIQTKKGKAMPCDSGRIPYVLDASGTLNIVTPDGDVVRARLDIMSNTFGYQSHFATCNGKERR